MKRQVFKMAALFVLLILPLSLMAQDRGQGRGQGDRAERMKQQQDELKKTLNLNKDQIVKFDEIHKNFDKKRQEMFSNMQQGGDRTEMREKMTKMNDELQASVKKILDKKQLKTYEAYLKKQAEERANRGNRGGDGRR